MKRLYVLAALFALLFGSQLLVTCSNPLERDDDPDPVPPRIDTIFLVDTVSSTDTLIVHDTTMTTDTLLVVDTVLEVDTLTIVDTTVLVDTLFYVDTLTQIDTVSVTDTVTLIDTVEMVDTTIIVDTLEIVVPDSTCIHTICDTLYEHNHKIFWTFGNMAGTYLLTFEATVENNQPPKELIVTIDGEEYIWHTDQSLVFTIEATLEEYSTIKIHPDKPMAFGHYVYVCLTFGKP